MRVARCEPGEKHDAQGAQETKTRDDARRDHDRRHHHVDGRDRGGGRGRPLRRAGEDPAGGDRRGERRGDRRAGAPTRWRRLPALEDLRLARGARRTDPWGSPFFIESLEDGVRVVPPGPDEELGTDDDVEPGVAAD
jgi:hypothetical protein